VAQASRLCGTPWFSGTSGTSVRALKRRVGRSSDDGDGLFACARSDRASRQAITMNAVRGECLVLTARPRRVQWFRRRLTHADLRGSFFRATWDRTGTDSQSRIQSKKRQTPNSAMCRVIGTRETGVKASGERGIRTPETVARLRDFQSRSFSHSDISPDDALGLFAEREGSLGGTRPRGTPPRSSFPAVAISARFPDRPPDRLPDQLPCRLHGRLPRHDLPPALSTPCCATTFPLTPASPACAPRSATRSDPQTHAAIPA
jgi:hypothetical protein